MAWFERFIGFVDPGNPFFGPLKPLDGDAFLAGVEQGGLTISDVNDPKPFRLSMPELRKLLASHDVKFHRRLWHVAAVYHEALYTPSPLFHFQLERTADGFIFAVPGKYRLGFRGSGVEARLTLIEYFTDESGR